MLNRLLLLSLLFTSISCQAQRKKNGDKEKVQAVERGLDSIAFHLYTDSLKKGVHNYINVDGHYTDGTWLPLTSRDIRFSCDAGKFDGNSLVLPADFAGEKVTITATHTRNEKLTRTVVIYIKKLPDNEKLPTKEEVLEELRNPGKKESRKKNRGLRA